jgi:hypothetical protein
MQTKKQAIKYFREFLLPSIPKNDIPAKREAWNNYTYALCKSRFITLRQYENWTNPF